MRRVGERRWFRSYWPTGVDAHRYILQWRLVALHLSKRYFPPTTVVVFVCVLLIAATQMLALCGAENVAVLIEKGGGATMRGGTLLHVACAHAQHETLQALIRVGEQAGGIDVDRADERRCTALHVAAGRGANDACALTLLRAGADHGALNARGHAALPPAAWTNAAPLVVDALIAAAARRPPPLTLLALAATDLRQLPDAFFDLAHLAIVDLSLNFLVELPSAVERLTALQELYVGYNQLVTLPGAALRRLTALSVLDVKGNPLDVPARITAAAVVNSSALEIEGVPLPALPLDLLASVPRVQQLVIRACGLERVARLVDQRGAPLLPELRMLSLSRNIIAKLSPRALTPFAATLTQLDLNDNRLSSLPRTLALLTSLQRLGVATNLLRCFPSLVSLLFRLSIGNITLSTIGEILYQSKHFFQSTATSLATRQYTRFGSNTSETSYCFEKGSFFIITIIM
jgi:hypothetical protein